MKSDSPTSSKREAKWEEVFLDGHIHRDVPVPLITKKVHVKMKFNKIIYFYPEKPVLILKESNALDEMSNDPDYVAELKYNGQRCELHFFNGNAEFWDRHGKHLDYNSNSLYKDGRESIVVELRKRFGYKGYFVFDGELRHNKAGVYNRFMIYDIHVYENEFLNRLIFSERRDILESHFEAVEYEDEHDLRYFPDIRPVSLSTQYPDEFRQLFIDAGEGSYGNTDEIEGIVIKNLNGKLKLGRSSSSHSMWMFKVRHATGRHRY